MIGQWEGKGGAGSFREGREEGGRDGGMEREEEEVEDGAEPRGLEEQQVARDLIAGDRVVWC